MPKKSFHVLFTTCNKNRSLIRPFYSTNPVFIFVFILFSNLCRWVSFVWSRERHKDSKIDKVNTVDSEKNYRSGSPFHEDGSREPRRAARRRQDHVRSHRGQPLGPQHAHLRDEGRPQRREDLHDGSEQRRPASSQVGRQRKPSHSGRLQSTLRNKHHLD